MTTSAGLVIVGSGPAGYTLANQLAALGFSGPITLVGDESPKPQNPFLLKIKIIIINRNQLSVWFMLQSGHFELASNHLSMHKI
jgi:2-polyprenyl-6-methoxyphenol hydroxylase-like FAD-dependent oxidoreductase